MVKTATVLEVVKERNGLRLKFSGRLDAEGVRRGWEKALSASRGEIDSVDAPEVEYCDGAGIALLWELQRRGGGEISGLKPEISKLLQPFEETERKAVEKKRPRNLDHRGDWQGRRRARKGLLGASLLPGADRCDLFGWCDTPTSCAGRTFGRPMNAPVFRLWSSSD